MRTRNSMGCVLGAALALAATTAVAEQAARSHAHEQYATTLWEFLQDSGYQRWQALQPAGDFDCGPPSGVAAKHYGKRATVDRQQEGAVIVTEHHAGDPPVLTAITVRLKRGPGFDAKNDDWYWVHFSPEGKAIETSADTNPWAKRGFAVFEEDGRLWVFEASCREVSDYLNSGELAKHVIRPGVGPAGMTLKGPDADTITQYVAAKPGFVTLLLDGRLWVFREDSEERKQFEQDGELAQHVIRPAAGPLGLTLKAPDAETLDAYLRACGL